MELPDGFETITTESISAHGSNAQWVVDEFSPFCNPRLLERYGDDFIIDKYYGQIYRRRRLLPASIYGQTRDLPAYSGDELANAGFLRVPFRRIPRVLVRNRKQLEWIIGAIKSADDNLMILFRGQNREHLIRRNAITTQWLYGEDQVLEPSLQTSASRRSPALETVLPEWSALLRVFAQSQPSIDRKAVEFMTNGYFPLFALALAQHYGLATSGLDVTPRLDVALFFALMKYERSAGECYAKYQRLTGTDAAPVIYVLSPAKRQQFKYDEFRPERFPSPRPDAQAAHFMHMGWGYETNAIARYIFLALYLDNSADWGPLPTVQDLFPTDRDAFAMFLEGVYKRNLSGQLGRALKEGFYTVQNQ